MTGIHEHPQADRLRAAREVPPPDSAHAAPASDPLSILSQSAVLIGCVLLAALAAIGLGIWTLCALLIAAACRAGFWLGVVVVAVLTRMMGVW